MGVLHQRRHCTAERPLIAHAGAGQAAISDIGVRCAGSLVFPGVRHLRRVETTAAVSFREQMPGPVGPGFITSVRRGTTPASAAETRLVTSALGGSL